MPLFKRMRTLNFPENHRFAPSDRVLRSALINAADRLSIRVDLEMLSMKAVSVKWKIDADDYCDVKSISIYVESFGFLCLPVDSYDILDDHVLLHFDALSREQTTTLKEMIKSHFFFVAKEGFAACSALSEPKPSNSNERATSRYESIS